MHKEFMESYGKYLLNHYYDLDNMTVAQLCEANKIAKTLKYILEAEKECLIIDAMEEGSSPEMEWDEFLTRMKKFYSEADASTKIMIKNELTKMINS